MPFTVVPPAASANTEHAALAPAASRHLISASGTDAMRIQQRRDVAGAIAPAIFFRSMNPTVLSLSAHGGGGIGERSTAMSPSSSETSYSLVRP